MSKSLGNVIDPFELVKKYGVDAVRYFLLREIPSTEDGDFTYEKFEERYNSDLASGLGNLVARVLTMVTKSKSVETRYQQTKGNRLFISFIKKTQNKYKKFVDNFKFNEALISIWDLISFCDKYIEKERPWEEKENQKEVISNLLFSLSEIAKLLQPFLPETSEKISKQLKTKKRESLFPRI
jgi:methionyl-tRNA synthetase